MQLSCKLRKLANEQRCPGQLLSNEFMIPTNLPAIGICQEYTSLKTSEDARRARQNIKRQPKTGGQVTSSLIKLPTKEVSNNIT
jgi:hypothetical protein